MKIEEYLPTPRDLWSAPQLAILSVLDTTLEMVASALLAEHPDVFDDEKPYWIRSDLSSAMAEEVISNIRSLCKTLEGYRYMLAEERGNVPVPDEGFPF
jgi:hypothetical protein